MSAAIDPNILALAQFAYQADQLRRSPHQESIYLGTLFLDHLVNEFSADGGFAKFTTDVAVATKKRREVAGLRDQERAKKWGPRVWRELHTLGLKLDSDGADLATVTEAIEKFTETIPCGDCKKHFAEGTKTNPPRPGEMFAYTVERHNEVNVRVTPPKPTMTLEAARALYAPPAA